MKKKLINNILLVLDFIYFIIYRIEFVFVRIPLKSYYFNSTKPLEYGARITIAHYLQHCVSLRSGNEIDYAYLVIATGSWGGKSNDVVVLGGGPAGVELAADAKEYYPHKNVTLIHSRKQLLQNFDAKLHHVAIKTLQELGVNVMLGERLSADAQGEADLSLHTRQTIPYKMCRSNSCNGECLKPHSILVDRVWSYQSQPTLQVTDPAFPNIYAAGDVAELGITPNSRAAMEQATVVADNVLYAIRGKRQAEYSYRLWQGGIELTLGITKEVLYLQDSDRVAFMHKKNKSLGLMSAGCWKILGTQPSVDQDEPNPV
ncbi:uncharacterized protein PAC_15482 [Phialocephala subalpina]|uniref:FAD/NAD(P)-binding domain-containing protein n=1 Tax=Phialocephala subalpina TaxID=576137 RepID=A0A1L7XKL5_9HELO|nr:uncharacterized protein PAC_15482 [Phialocephala subalpina]